MPPLILDGPQQRVAATLGFGPTTCPRALARGLVRTLQSGSGDFRSLTDLHAKFLITDTTALNGSADFTQASAEAASEVATFFSDPLLMHDLRGAIYAYGQRARPY